MKKIAVVTAALLLMAPWISSGENLRDWCQKKVATLERLGGKWPDRLEEFYPECKGEGVQPRKVDALEKTQEKVKESEKSVQYGPKGTCRILAGNLEGVSVWRDNGVPIAKAHENVERALEIGNFSEGSRKVWHYNIVLIYNRQQEAENNVKILRATCEAMPEDPVKIESGPDKHMRCSSLADMCVSIADARNSGGPPDHAYQTGMQYLQFLSKYDPSITKDRIKDIVNQIYFDPGFSRAGGMPFLQQVYEACMTGVDPYGPLK